MKSYNIGDVSYNVGDVVILIIENDIEGIHPVWDDLLRDLNVSNMTIGMIEIIAEAALEAAVACDKVFSLTQVDPTNWI